MNLPEQTPEIRAAVLGAFSWFRKNQVDDVKFANGKVVASPGDVMWYRFYDVENDKPFHANDDGEKFYDMTDLGSGYSWAGNWAEELLATAPLYENPDFTGRSKL